MTDFLQLPETINSFKSRSKRGVLLRVYASDPAHVKKRVDITAEAVEELLEINFPDSDTSFFQRIDLLVWADSRYSGSDCGDTAAALRERLKDKHGTVFIHEFTEGDLYCDILNYGAATHLRDGIDYSMIMSAEARSYLTSSVIEEISQAAVGGARAIGLAINELTESILSGRLANTFALWHNLSLMTVGGFNPTARKPADGEVKRLLEGAKKPDGEYAQYHIAGVEEVLPLAFMTKTFGECIAPILPDEVGQYEVPDDPKLRERHKNKMYTKKVRQDEMLARVGSFAPDFITSGVMKKYQNQN